MGALKTRLWLPVAGSASPQLHVLGLELQFLANQVQELRVGEAWLDLQGDCVFVMHLEDVGAGDGCFGLLWAVSWMSELVWLGEGRERDQDVETVVA